MENKHIKSFDVYISENLETEKFYEIKDLKKHILSHSFGKNGESLSFSIKSEYAPNVGDQVLVDYMRFKVYNVSDLEPGFNKSDIPGGIPMETKKPIYSKVSLKRIGSEPEVGNSYLYSR